jgi:hypothetical protein
LEGVSDDLQQRQAIVTAAEFADFSGQASSVAINLTSSRNYSPNIKNRVYDPHITPILLVGYLTFRLGLIKRGLIFSEKTSWEEEPRP